MRIRRISFILLLGGMGMFLGGCSSQPESTADLFSDRPVYELKAEGRLPWTLRGAGSFLVFADRIVLRQYKNTEFLLSLHDLATGDTLKTFALYGEGPDEYTFIGGPYRINDSVFVTWSGNTNEYASFYNLNECSPEQPFHPFYRIDLREVKTPHKGKMFDPLYAVFTPKGDTILLGRALPVELQERKMYATYLAGERKLNYFEDFPLYTGTDQPYPVFVATNLYYGPMAINRAGDRLFSAVFFGDILDFLQVDPQGQITPIKQYHFAPPVFQERGKMASIILDKTIRYYRDIQWNDGKVYVLTASGKTIRQERELEQAEYDRLEATGEENIYTSIYVFSQYGDPLYTLRLDVNPLMMDFWGDTLYVDYYNVEGDKEVRFYDLSSLP